MNKNIRKIFCVIVLVTFQNFLYSSPIKSDMLSNELFVTGEDGVLRMSVNVIGHVKYPGAYIVYDGIDLMTLISLAGGYLPGSNLKKIVIRHSDGSNERINLNDIMFKDRNHEYSLKPRDTIYIEQRIFSKIITSSNLPTIFLSILNIALTLERTD